MNPSDLAGVLEFLRATEKLKTVRRSGWTSAGEPESVADHTWRLCLMALVLHPALPDVDLARLLKICIVHDLGEVDPLLMPESVQPFDEVLRKVGPIATSVSRLSAACFAFALLLALAGTFGLMSRSIGLRTREIGLRRALGATDASVTRFLLRQGGRQLGVGALLAAPVMLLIGMGFMHFFPVGGWVPLTAGVLVPATIVALILAATWVPTRAVRPANLSARTASPPRPSRTRAHGKS